MHLLHYVNGKLSLTRFIGSNIPPYAILSHTWGTDAEEVTFEELLEGIGENKAGYEKIRLCGAQAIKDGLEYFWVDTCCIDKRSSAGLSEAINSMYRWYQLARFCYVHLADVTLVGDVLDSDTRPETLQERAPNFYKSRWFTRGWTLQELLAPHALSLRFYTADWNMLGTRNDLASHVSHITKIRPEYLISEGRYGWMKIYSASVAERMSWASRRVTTRE